MLYFVIILSILLCVSIFININLLRKNEAYEDSVADADKYVYQLEEWVKTLRDRVVEGHRRLKEIDRRGSFESDDEVGFFFKELTEIMEDINQLTKR